MMLSVDGLCVSAKLPERDNFHGESRQGGKFYVSAESSLWKSDVSGREGNASKTAVLLGLSLF